MNENPTEKKNKTSAFARFVRLTPEEHTQLLEDEKRTGRSAQELLKRVYFGKSPIVLLMSDVDRDEFLAQINRIGNNVNQIAKKLNTGIVFGFDQELSHVRILLTHLMNLLTAKYVQSKPKRDAV